MLDLKLKHKFCISRLCVFGWTASFSLHTLIALSVHGFIGGSNTSVTPQNIKAIEVELSGRHKTSKSLQTPNTTTKNHHPILQKGPKKNVSKKNTIGSNTIGSNQSILTPDSSNHYPEYPEEAKNKGIEGEFMIRLVLNHKGFVKDIIFLKSGHPFLKKIILSTLKLWRFTSPHNLDNTELKLPIVFKLVE